MAISSKPTSGESEGRIATKAFRKRGFTFSLTTKPQESGTGHRECPFKQRDETGCVETC
jgi:hypothetical protein